MHKIDEVLGKDSEDALGSLELFSLSEKDKQAIWLMPELNDQVVKMELDTGSAVSVMSESDYKVFFSKEKLNLSSIFLKTYTGKKVRPRGVLPVTVEYNSQKEILNLYILPNRGLERDQKPQVTAYCYTNY